MSYMKPIEGTSSQSTMFVKTSNQFNATLTMEKANQVLIKKIQDGELSQVKKGQKKNEFVLSFKGPQGEEASISVFLQENGKFFYRNGNPHKDVPMEILISDVKLHVMPSSR